MLIDRLTTKITTFYASFYLDCFLIYAYKMYSYSIQDVVLDVKRNEATLLLFEALLFSAWLKTGTFTRI